MKTEARQRISLILDNKGINAKQLSERMGMKRPQALYDIISGKTKCISENVAIKITSAFPDINSVWLLTGEGEMLKGVQTATENSAPVYQNSGNGGNNVTQTAGAPSSTIDKLIEEMRAQREMSAQQIERLLTIIENMTKPNKNNTNE